MNLTHLHLMLNHLPVVGSVCALGLLAFALWRRSHDLKRAALGVLVISALAAIPAHLTGEPAEETVRGLPGVSQPVIERHEEAAGVALGALLAVGAVALGGLLVFRDARPMPAWFSIITLLGTLVVSGCLAWTASLGGQVRHTEIRSTASPASERAADRD